MFVKIHIYIIRFAEKTSNIFHWWGQKSCDLKKFSVFDQTNILHKNAFAKFIYFLNVKININKLVRKTSKSFIVDVKGHVLNQTLILF